MQAILMQTLAMIHTHGIHIVIYISIIGNHKGGRFVDFSQQENGVFINLEPNSWSSLDYPNGIENLNESEWVYENGQIYISENSYIEKVFGSDFNDIINDNTSNNTIYAGNGDDTLFFSGGKDIFDGGEGNDIIKIDYSFSDIHSIDISDQGHILFFNHYLKSPILKTF